jgi:dTDP-4-amino-4,6-dideoxygalactose transaminase
MNVLVNCREETMIKRIPFLDLRVESDADRQELLSAIDAVFRHGRLVMGPEVEELERQVAAYCGRQFGVGVNSGTDALLLALKSLGLGPGDEVITTSLSWIATANAIALTGATPVFADVRDDLNIDPESVRRLITPRTKAVLPVHYTGKVCQVPALVDLCERHGLTMIEDAAQAFGAGHHGRKAGSFGTLACFSMNPMKVYAACGEAGMVLTDSRDLYESLIALRYNGTVNRETCVRPSLNGRIDTIQAAILLKRLPAVEGIARKRRAIAARYQEQLAGVVELPTEAAGEYDVYYTFIIRCDRRDKLKIFLEAKGIETKIQHQLLMPEQPAYRTNPRGHFPNAQRLVKRILCLPVHEKLSLDDADYVAEAVREFFKR